MREARQRAHLGSDALLPLVGPTTRAAGAVQAVGAVEHLDGDVPVEAEVEGPVDRACSPAPEKGVKPVAPVEQRPDQTVSRAWCVRWRDVS
jgi:hypothetical protein